MEYKELSPINVKEISEELYKKIVKEYDYDLVIFIAKGSFEIGKELSDLKNVPLLEIKATRKGGKIKKLLKPLMKIIPKNVLVKLRKKEMNSSYHATNTDRNIVYNEKIMNKYKDKKKILLVDDSIDSGYSVIKAKEKLNKIFIDSNIKVAVLNVMSKAIIKPDYTVFENYMLNGPWSNDSRYNGDFKKNYESWKNHYER